MRMQMPARCEQLWRAAGETAGQSDRRSGCSQVLQLLCLSLRVETTNTNAAMARWILGVYTARYYMCAFMLLMCPH
jgi:hypothetical protein